MSVGYNFRRWRDGLRSTWNESKADMSPSTAEPPIRVASDEAQFTKVFQHVMEAFPDRQSVDIGLSALSNLKRNNPALYQQRDVEALSQHPRYRQVVWLLEVNAIGHAPLTIPPNGLNPK